MLDYADRITSKRIKSVINGYGEGKEFVNGINSDFSFFELGEPLFIGEKLNDNIDIEKIKEYVYYCETKQNLEISNETYYLGTYLNTSYYFYYEKDKPTTLNREFLHQIKIKSNHYVIYSNSCVLSENQLRQYNITFKKLPRDIIRF